MSGEYTPFLEDGEQVDYVVKALAGPNRWLGLGIATVVGLAVALALGGLNGSVFLGLIALYLVFTCLYVRHLILITDRAVVLVSGNRISFKPKALVERLPADTPLRPLKGLWLQLQLDGHRLYVSSRSIRQVSAVEAERRDGKRP